MKHKTLTAILLLLVFSIAMSLISVKNYVSSLNTVVVTDTYVKTLRTQDTVAGFLHFLTTTEMELPAGCKIEKELVSVGEDVRPGQALVQLCKDDLLLCRLQLMLSKEQLQDPGGLSALEKEIAALKIGTIDAQLELVETLIAEDGALKSTVSGQVVGLPSAGGTVEIGDYSGGFYCSWEVPKNSNKAFTSISGKLSQKDVAFEVDMVNYHAGKGVYEYRSQPFPAIGVNTTLPIEVNLVYSSPEYRAVLPKTCIRIDSDGSTFVYVVQERAKVYGTELYLFKKGVTILEEDDNYAAVIAALENVVAFARKTPVNLEAVRVIE